MLLENTNRNFRMPTILLIIMVFFGHLFPFGNYYHMLFIVLVSTYISAFRNKGKLLINNNLIWILCVFILIVSLIFSYDSLSTLKFTLMFFCILFIKMLYEGQEKWQSFFVKVLFYASLIHVLLTLAQFIFPNVINSINSLILSGQDFNKNSDLLYIGSYAGITGQTGINAFFISIFIAIVYCKLMNSPKRKFLLVIILTIAMVALFLTVKRSQLIVNGIAMLSIFFLFSKREGKSKIKLIAIPIVVFSIGYLILVSIPATSNVLAKFAVYADSSDITNGRTDLWIETISIFEANPVIGIGAGTIYSYIGEMTHNIYIQILAEMGVFGFVVFSSAFILSLINTVKILKSSMKNTVFTNEQRYLLALGSYLQIYFIIYGLSGNPLYSPIYLIVYMLMISIVNSIHLTKKISN